MYVMYVCTYIHVRVNPPAEKSKSVTELNPYSTLFLWPARISQCPHDLSRLGEAQLCLQIPSLTVPKPPTRRLGVGLEGGQEGQIAPRRGSAVRRPSLARTSAPCHHAERSAQYGAPPFLTAKTLRARPGYNTGLDAAPEAGHGKLAEADEWEMEEKNGMARHWLGWWKPGEVAARVSGQDVMT